MKMLEIKLTRLNIISGHPIVMQIIQYYRYWNLGNLLTLTEIRMLPCWMVTLQVDPTHHINYAFLQKHASAYKQTLNRDIKSYFCITFTAAIYIHLM